MPTAPHRLTGFLLALGIGVCGGEPPDIKRQAIRAIAEVRALSREEANRKLPVEISGVVVVRTTTGCFIHDGRDCIWANYFEIPGEIRKGCAVRVKGVTDQTAYSPRIIVERLEAMGKSPLPEAPRVSMERLLSGAADNQYIELEGVIQQGIPSARIYAPLMLLAVDGQLCRLKVQQAAGFDPRGLVDARARVRGVFQSRLNLRGQAVGLELFADHSEIQVITPPPSDPFSAPRIPINQVLTFSPEQTGGHRRRVAGRVTFTYPGKFFFLQDETAAIRVDGTGAGIKPGASAEVVGFAMINQTLANLGGCMIRESGSQSPPVAESVDVHEILEPELSDPWSGMANTDLNGRLVKLEGRLLRVSSNQEDSETTLLMEASGTVFSAYLPVSAADADEWKAGSHLELCGACELEFHSRTASLENVVHPISGFHLWIASPEDVHVLQAPSWWTPERLTFTLEGTLVVLLSLLVWSVLLRREVARKGKQLALEIAAKREAEVEFEAVVRERTRLGHDLHDSLEQSLTGVSLQLQAAELFRFDAPDRSAGHLALAQQVLDQSRDDLHRTVWDLHALRMDQEGFGETLRMRARMLNADNAADIRVVIKEPVDPLDDLIAGNLLLLAQEAMANALKHGEPKNVTVEVASDAKNVTIRIVDDGRGFEPGTVPGHREGHFGLQGMRERVKRLGGKLAIRSAPGEGTSIEASVPTAAEPGGEAP